MKPTLDVTRFADMLSAMGTEPRLRIMRLLLSAHPEGMVVGEISNELEIANSVPIKQQKTKQSAGGHIEHGIEQKQNSTTNKCENGQYIDG